MSPDLNYLAILASAIASFVIGFLWYSPQLFGNIWLKGMHFREDHTKGANMGLTMGIGFLMTLLMVYVLAHYISYMDANTASQGAESAFWPWLGFMLPIMAGQVLWERKSFKVFAINASHYLVVLIVSGIILAVWQ